MNSISKTEDTGQSLHSGIWSPSFQGLLWTQWLTAINDNVFRWFVIGVGKDQFTPENLGTLLVVGSAFFIVPYIIFASVAGWLADRFKKSHVIVGCKIAEIVIMALGVLAVSMMGDPDPVNQVDPYFYVLLIVVFFMGTQSALFAPAKVGTIPELLDEKTISAGNGIFNLVTLSATVIGMALGGWLSDVTGRGQDKIWLAFFVLVGIAIVGTMLSFLVRSLPAANRKARFPITLIGETVVDIVGLVRRGKLFRIALGIVFFWSIAAFAQINIDFFSEEGGGLIESHRTPLLIAVTLGIGLGSVLAGYISAGRIELGLVPWGALGISVFAILLWFAPAQFIDPNGFDPKLIVACLFLTGLGMSAGVFDVPLASYLQHNSPIEKRGSILAATNCLAFSGILLMFGLLLLLRKPTHEGSIVNLPASMNATELSQPQKLGLENILNDYKAQPDLLKSEPNIRPFVERAAKLDSNLRSPAISELVILDSKMRRDASQSVLLDDYTNDFPNSDVGDFPAEARQIKQAMLQSGKLPLLTSRQIFLVMGLLAIPVFFYATYRLGQGAVRIGFWVVMNVLYKIKITGMENVPETGGGVIVSNHTSWLDGAVMLVLIPRVPRTVAWAGNFNNWIMKKWADFCGVILIAGGPKSIRKGLNSASQTLENGELVGIFPEGGISRTGQLRTFKPGLQKIIGSQNVPVIPVYIHETWGSIFSYWGGKVITKFPNSIRRPLSVQIGEPISNPDTMFQIRQSVANLSADAVQNEVGSFIAPAAAFVKSCKKKKFKSKIGDSTNQEETGGSLLTRALVLRRLMRKHILPTDEINVGILIPPTVGGAIVNLALSLDKRVAINLNYSLSQDLINHCIKTGGIKHVLTTRKVMDKFKLQLDCEISYLDDLKDKVTGSDKAICAFQSYALPGFMLNRVLGLHRLKPDDVMTIVFTSGSTGVPKGVMLTQRNIMSNVNGIDHVASFTPHDTMVGILPFFHSMGFTATLWAPMACNLRGVYHFSPLDAKIIGKLIEKFSGTIIVATPTFLRSYMRRCTPEQLKTLDTVVAGAERLPPELCDEFEEKFGVRPVEGYGATELSPITSVNIPPSRQPAKKFQVDCKEGTVGRTMPNIAAKITHLDTGEDLGANEAGMLWIKGPNVMKGYLNMPEATADVLVDGWYKTGDVALIDNDGFIKITGRMSRFSKIGGEMVPHLKIEEVLSRFLDQTPDDDSDDHLSVAVTAVSDPKKGERLIVLHTTDAKSTDEMCDALKSEGLPNIFIPSSDSFFRVEKLPLLGTGKLDLKGIKEMALEKTEGNGK